MFSDIYRWYRGFIPPFGSDNFYRFLESSGRLAAEVLNLYGYNYPVRIRFSNAPSAYSDKPHNLIVLPYWELQPANWKSIEPHMPDIDPADYSAAVLAFITSSLLHESGHFVFSPETPDEQAAEATHPDVDEFLDENGRALMALLQIVEDLYIEHQLTKLPYGFFIHIFNNVCIPLALLEANAAEFANDPTGTGIIRLLLTYKTESNRAHDVWGSLRDGTQALLEQALDAHQASDRANIACELYKLYRDLFENGGEQYPQDAPSEWSTDRNGECSPSGADAVRDLPEMDDSFIEAMQEVSEMIEQYIRQPLPDPNRFSNDIPPIQEIDVTSLSMGRTVMPAPEFAAFGTLLRDLRSKNYPPGPPLETGRRILNTRISRIATDGKVFGYSYEKDKKEEAEVIISINASGSMEYLFGKVMSAAYGTLESLKKNRIYSRVYIHTTRGRNPLLVFVGDSQNVGIETRFARAMGVNKAYSYDGAVIAELGKRFSERNNTKVLIEMNDGEPNCGDYTGREAVRHTKRAVDNLRKQGIVVLCLSLDSNVVEPNNEIYGKRFNIDASRNINIALQRALREVLV